MRKMRDVTSIAFASKWERSTSSSVLTLIFSADLDVVTEFQDVP
jgi:hypothetical protein